VCHCNPTYPAYNTHSPHYIVICTLSGCTIFSTLSHNLYDFREKSYWIQNMFCFLWNIFHSKKNLARYHRRCTYVPVKYQLFCQILMEFEFSWQIFDKYSHTKFHENSSSGSRDVPCEKTDWRRDKHDEANSHISQFFERVRKVHQRPLHLLSILSSWG